MHLVRANGKSILLDCGIFQGKRSEAFERNSHFPFEPSSIDAVILSHAHIDHAGNLPNLVKSGFSGPIYCTSASKDLCDVMLYDTAYLQERDAEYVSRKRARRGEPAVEPLYTAVDVSKTIAQIAGVEYHKPFQVTDGIECSFSDAGHILGSAATRLTLDAEHKKCTLGFTGDLGRRNTPILRDPEPIDPVDFLICESTYGGKIHDPLTSSKEALRVTMEEVVIRGGKLIIPSFSVGRTQEIVYTMNELFNEGHLPQLPIFVDSPLAVNATDVFRRHRECFDKETLDLLQYDDDPFGFERLTYVRSVEESKKLNGKEGPLVIIAASGMCEGGRVLHHLANSIEDPKNTILIVGFQAEHTLGRRLVEQDSEVKIFGDVYKREAVVKVLNSFSAHAGQDDLMEYAKRTKKPGTGKVFLVHGEVAQAGMLAAKLESLNLGNVVIPEKGDIAELTA